MEILTMKSKELLGCNCCDKCCINRGDIRITPLNACMISKYLKISLVDFYNTYTEELKEEAPEKVLKAVGEKYYCIMHEPKTRTCKINSVKPIQCAIFPLFPEDIQNDFFSNQGTCTCTEKKLITVKKWLNGNNNIYKKNKEVNLLWVDLMKELQDKWPQFLKEDQKQIEKKLFYEYDLKKYNIKKQVIQNIKYIFNKYIAE